MPRWEAQAGAAELAPRWASSSLKPNSHMREESSSGRLQQSTQSATTPASRTLARPKSASAVRPRPTARRSARATIDDVTTRSGVYTSSTSDALAWHWSSTTSSTSKTLPRYVPSTMSSSAALHRDAWTTPTQNSLRRQRPCSAPARRNAAAPPPPLDDLDDDDKFDRAADTLDEGNALHDRGDSYGALVKYAECLAHGRTIEDPDLRSKVESAAQSSCGSAHYSRGQCERAIKAYEAAYALKRELRDDSGAGSDLISLGLAYRGIGRYDKAVVALQSAGTIRDTIEARTGETPDWVLAVAPTTSADRSSRRVRLVKMKHGAALRTPPMMESGDRIVNVSRRAYAWTSERK